MLIRIYSVENISKIVRYTESKRIKASRCRWKGRVESQKDFNKRMV